MLSWKQTATLSRHQTQKHLWFLALAIEPSSGHGWHSGSHLLQGCRIHPSQKNQSICLPIFWNAHSHKMVSAEARPLKVRSLSPGVSSLQQFA